MWAPSKPERRSVGHRSAIFHWVWCPVALLIVSSFASVVPAGKASADENCRHSYILNGWCPRNEPKTCLWGSLFKKYLEQNVCRRLHRQKVGKKKPWKFLLSSSFSCLDSLWCRTCWLPCWRPDHGWLLFLQQNAFPVLILRRWQLYLDYKCTFPQEA